MDQSDGFGGGRGRGRSSWRGGGGGDRGGGGGGGRGGFYQQPQGGQQQGGFFGGQQQQHQGGYPQQQQQQGGGYRGRGSGYFGARGKDAKKQRRWKDARSTHGDDDDEEKQRSLSPSPTHTLDSTHANLPRSPLLAPSLPPGGYRGRGGAPRGGGGRGAGGRGPAGAPFDGQPEDIDFLKVLRGHSRQVTAAVIDPSTQRLYTGSQDGTVRCWLMAESDGSGTPGPVVDVGGEVDSLLLEGGFLFVGLHGPPPQRPGTIKAFNLASGASCSLEGHVGQVLCLACATGTGTLLSGGQDATIRAWAFDEATSAFVAAGVLAAAQGGHSSPVQALAPAGQFLVSGDWEGTLKVWDLASGACAQTIPRAHPSVVMGCLTWEGHVLSAGLDGAIKVWAPVEGAPGPGKVLEPAPMYSHPPADSRDRSGSGTGEPGRSAAADGGAPSPSGFGGILALGGTVDAKGGALVAASHADDGQVRLWELPSFAEKGSLGGVADARALAASPGGVVAVGDKRGNVKVWRWKTG